MITDNPESNIHFAFSDLQELAKNCKDLLMIVSYGKLRYVLISSLTGDAFPAAKIRKEGIQRIFNVNHILVTLRWEEGRSPSHKNVCRWFLKRHK